MDVNQQLRRELSTINRFLFIMNTTSFFQKVTGKLGEWKQKGEAYLEQQRAEAERKRQEEEARQQAIVSGKIEPITVTFSLNLDTDEKAYVAYDARRMAMVEYVEEHTEGTSKKKGGITRAIVGGVLLAPTGLGVAGAIVGAATAASKHSSITKQVRSEKLESVDKGKIVFTNRRVIFLGNTVLSIPYKEIVSVGFDSSGNELHLKYQAMLKNEFFDLSGSGVEDARLYFEGITKNLVEA